MGFPCLTVRTTEISPEEPSAKTTEKAENVDNAYDIFKKQKEKEKHFTKQVDVLKSIPDSFPALMKTEKIINKLYKMYPDFAEKHKDFPSKFFSL